jgi:CheY-like chemotaxis protein
MNLSRPRPARRDEPSLAEPMPPRSKLLLVDDTLANLRAFASLLEEPGLEIRTAASGTEALRLLLTEEFAVILLDVGMPVLDGLETAAFIRRNRKARHTPIIFMSADERTPLDVARSDLDGTIDYCFRPVDGELLRRKVSFFVEFHQRILQLKEGVLELTRRNAQKETRIRRLREINAKLRLQLERAPQSRRRPGGE